jgi:DNA-binding LacI/PurR family transcriptional regulator
MQKLPSIRELSVTMGASVSTLTGALEELENQNLVYRRHGVGIFVSPARVRSIWLLCDSQFFSQGHSPFWDVLVQQARIRALQNNEQLSMHFTLPHGLPDATLHHALVEEIRAGRVHGIIGIGLNHSVAEWILEQEVPFTAFAGWAPYVVSLDATELVRQGVAALVNQGCRRIGFWKTSESLKADEKPVPESSDPAHVFIQSLKAHQLPLVPELIKAAPRNLPDTGQDNSVSESFPEQVYRVAQEVFGTKKSDWPDGIVITDDTMTQGALLAMARLGVRPGRDVMLASHANKGTSVLLGDEDNIIRLEYDPAEVVRKLFALLETLMDGNTPENTSQYYFDAEALLVEPGVVMPHG